MERIPSYCDVLGGGGGERGGKQEAGEFGSMRKLGGDYNAGDHSSSSSSSRTSKTFPHQWLNYAAQCPVLYNVK